VKDCDTRSLFPYIFFLHAILTVFHTSPLYLFHTTQNLSFCAFLHAWGCVWRLCAHVLLIASEKKMFYRDRKEGF
jgi:hypothetical protein